MSIEQYWMGKNIDCDAIWRDFDDGQAYIKKVSMCDLHLLRLKFDSPGIMLPLFYHEAIFKTIKGTFHDVKQECYSEEKYNSLTPIFLHNVRRGSGIFEFLGQLDPILVWVTALGGASLGYRSLRAKDQKFDEDRLSFIRKEFPGASKEDELAYMKAWTTFGSRRVLHRLIQQGLTRVELSEKPVTDEIEKTEPAVVNLAGIVSLDEKNKNG